MNPKCVEIMLKKMSNIIILYGNDRKWSRAGGTQNRYRWTGTNVINNVKILYIHLKFLSNLTYSGKWVDDVNVWFCTNPHFLWEQPQNAFYWIVLVQNSSSLADILNVKFTFDCNPFPSVNGTDIITEGWVSDIQGSGLDKSLASFVQIWFGPFCQTLGSQHETFVC